MVLYLIIYIKERTVERMLKECFHYRNIFIIDIILHIILIFCHSQSHKPL